MPPDARRTAPHAASLLEPLEPRIALSDTYYAWISVESLPGFAPEYGEPAAIVGASDNGRYLWSWAAANRGGPDEPYIVIDGEVLYLRDMPDLADAELGGINSAGTVLARDIEGDDLGRTFLLDLAGGERMYLDELALNAPADFDLAAAEPMAISDGGGLVLYTPAEEELRQLWIIIDLDVTRLWKGYDEKQAIDVNALNGVLRWRPALWDAPALLWTPERGMVDLDQLGITHAGSLNNDGTLFAKLDKELVLWRDGEVQKLGFRDESDPHYGGSISYFPGSRDGLGRFVYEELANVNYGVYRLFSPDGDSTIAVQNPGHDFVRRATESGLLLNPASPGGWFAIVSVEPIVTSIAGSIATVWADESGATIEALNVLGGRLRFTLDDSGGMEWAPIGDAARDEAIPWEIVYDAATDRWLALSTYRGELDSFNQQSQSPFNNHDERITHAPTGFFLPDTRAVVAGLGDDGHLILLWQPRIDVLHNYWTDLSEKHLGPQGLRTPEFVGGLASFATRWNAMNIVGLDASGDVHAVWWSPARGDAGWTTSNLSDIAGAPPLVGDVTAAATPWGGMQIFGTDARGHLMAIWWSPQTGRWRTTDLTAHTEGLLLERDSLTARLMPAAGISVVGKSAEGEVAAYWWTPRTGWVSESISDRLGAAAPIIPGLVTYQTTRSGNQHIAGVNAEGDMLHIWWRPDGTNLWRVENLTERALG